MAAITRGAGRRMAAASATAPVLTTATSRASSAKAPENVVAAFEAKVRALCGAQPLSEDSMSRRIIGVLPGLYGHGDTVLGVSVPPLRELAKDESLTLDATEALLACPIHEVRTLAVHRLRRLYALGGKKDASLRHRAVAAVVLRNLHRLNNWDLVDTICPFVLGSIIAEEATLSAVHALPTVEELKKRKAVPSLELAEAHGSSRRVVSFLEPSMPTLTALATLPPDLETGTDPKRGIDRTLFLRRVGVVSALSFAATPVGCQAALSLAATALNDRHDLMHKAAGWVLRQVGDGDQAALCAFLDQHSGTMPRTMLRYAIEHLPRALQTAYMTGKTGADAVAPAPATSKGKRVRGEGKQL